MKFMVYNDAGNADFVEVTTANVESFITAMASRFASAAQGVLADSAVQPTRVATLATVGVIKQATALVNPAAVTFTNNIGGVVSSTLAAVPTIATVLSTAASATDVLLFRTNVMNALSSLAAGQNSTRARLEELIANLRSGGQLA